MPLATYYSVVRTPHYLVARMGYKVQAVKAMAATFGKIEELDREREAWSQYVEQLGYFFEAN